MIPKGFFRIACSEFTGGKSEVYFNRERKLLLLVNNESPIGFIKPEELPHTLHVLKDVSDMKGRYGQV